MEGFVACFAEVVDPRQENACHDMRELLLIAPCNMLTGGKDCSDMALFGEPKERFLRLRHGSGRKTTVRAELEDGPRVRAEAEALFIASRPDQS